MSDRFQCFGHSHWPEWIYFRRYNWCDFPLINAEIEWSRSLGDFDIRFALLGFSAGASYNYNPNAPMRVQLREQMAEIMAEGKKP